MRPTYVRYKSAEPSNYVPAQHRGNGIIMRLLVLAIAIGIAWLLYGYFTSSPTPTIPLEPTVAPTIVSTPDPVLVPCVAVSDACGNVTPVGVKVAAGTIGYHRDADGRVRINPPAGWISMPDCKAQGLRVWVETDENKDVIAYHCAK